MTMIDTPEGIAFARVLALRSALTLKVNSGLNVYRGSLVQVTNRTFGTSFRTNAQCLAHVNGVLSEFDAQRASQDPR